MTCCGNNDITTPPPPPPPAGPDCFRVRYICTCPPNPEVWTLVQADCVVNALCTGQISCTPIEAYYEFFNQCMIAAPLPPVPGPVANEGDLVLNVPLCKPICCPDTTTTTTPPPTTTTPPPTTTTTTAPPTTTTTTAPPSEPCVDCSGAQFDVIVSGLIGPCAGANGSWTQTNFQDLPAVCVWEWYIGGFSAAATLVYNKGTGTWEFELAGEPPVPAVITCSGGYLSGSVSIPVFGCATPATFTFGPPAGACADCPGPQPSITLSGYVNCPVFNGTYVYLGQVPAPGGCQWMFSNGGNILAVNYAGGVWEFYPPTSGAATVNYTGSFACAGSLSGSMECDLIGGGPCAGDHVTASF